MNYIGISCFHSFMILCRASDPAGLIGCPLLVVGSPSAHLGCPSLGVSPSLISSHNNHNMKFKMICITLGRDCHAIGVVIKIYNRFLLKKKYLRLPINFTLKKYIITKKRKKKQKPTTSGVPRRSPIQVLTGPDVA